MKTLNRILATAIAAAGLLGTALPAYANSRPRKLRASAPT